MTVKEAIDYIESQTWSSTRLGLERTRELLSKLGDPQKKLRFVHVAGTNGKGSTCAMLASILQAAGYRTGLYTSPYICRFNERIQVNGENIPDETLAALTALVMPLAEQMRDHPSQFELVTAIAMQYFLDAGCDIVVLEVGLGGALDSTNVIDRPEAAVITNIGLEHTEYLGNTLAEIAAAKAGIIKPGCTAVCYRGTAEVETVFENTCRERGAQLVKADFAALRPISADLAGQYFSWQGLERLFLPLLGAHQLHNAAVVLETVDVLRRHGWRVPEAALRQGLAQTVWPARFELLRREPVFLVDGAHNPQCVQALVQAIEAYLPGERVTFLTGVLADKDYVTMLRCMAPYALHFVCVTPDSPRALPAQELAAALRVMGLSAEAAEDIDTGISAALQAAGAGPVVACGSLYMAGLVRRKAKAIFQA